MVTRITPAQRPVWYEPAALTLQAAYRKDWLATAELLTHLGDTYWDEYGLPIMLAWIDSALQAAGVAPDQLACVHAWDTDRGQIMDPETTPAPAWIAHRLYSARGLDDEAGFLAVLEEIETLAPTPQDAARLRGEVAKSVLVAAATTIRQSHRELM